MIAGTAGTVHAPTADLPAEGAFCAPTLIAGLSPADPLMQDEIFGPVLVSGTFRTPKEAAQIANNTRYGLAASVWTENVNLALGLAPELAAGIVWINGTNMFDAAAGFGGVRDSGFGREGGWEGLRAYTRPAQPEAELIAARPAAAPETPRAPTLDRTAKMYIGGKQARPDGGASRTVWSPDGRLLGHVGTGSRKDIRNAVEAARKAQPGWATAGGPLRAQILYFLAENLSARASEFAARIDDLTGTTTGVQDVTDSIERLFTWAAWADKQDGAVKPVPLRGLAVAVHEPVGVIGVVAPDAPPLLGLLSVLAPAIALGNTTVLVPSEAGALLATDLYQVLDTSDLPAGVVNIVTGAPADLAPVLAAHADVDAVWSFAAADLSSEIETAAAGNLKRTWVPRRHDWSTADSAAFRAAATETKTIWVPYGE